MRFFRGSRKQQGFSQNNAALASTDDNQTAQDEIEEQQDEQQSSNSMSSFSSDAEIPSTDNNTKSNDDNGSDSSSSGAEENQPPIANAGDDLTVNERETVTLSGVGSTDPDNDSLRFSWKQTVGEPTISLDGSNADTATFQAPAVDG
ncbi:PKD domain-containing protein [Candidatus Nitrososphaera gargensis Ga9.2]|uniref:PKD domain-containing protein n=1 Tax=Nitrososphaera gargensis (strain Ga9.2) TaxID=1237085 RepID=K0IP25_NITGG|nr:hypothetical protein [Candidatus Nitrososphaera gargensis]AFU60384.1 PKD domain-containing protein [Candidatus Nitrososphaera gargensis Ga9.2]